MIHTSPNDNPKLLFDARLLPNRSLGPFGIMLILGGVSALSFGAGIAFYLAGAWPVLGFLGLDVVLLVLAFHIHQKRQRAYERLTVTEETLVYEQVTWHGQCRRWTFPSFWVRLDLAEDTHPAPLLRLSSHGLTALVGRSLSQEDLLDLAENLRIALAKAKAG
jgi:uncharacterized membrane protein